MKEFKVVRELVAWVLLAGFASVMLFTLLFWWLNYRKILVLKGLILEAGEPNIPILIAELISLTGIIIVALVQVVLLVIAYVYDKGEADATD